MILAVDIGNTNIVVGCIKGEEICFVERMSTEATRTELEYAISFKNVLEMYGISIEQLDGGIISSVVPPVTNIVKRSVEKILNTEVMLIGPGVKTGLNILMDDPRQVGSDRIVNAVAVVHEYPVPRPSLIWERQRPSVWWMRRRTILAEQSFRGCGSQQIH